MSQLQNIARILLAAGADVHPQQGKGVYLLYIEDGTLISKLWAEDNFSDQELIADSARPDSTAAYLTTSSSKSVVYISPTSTLSVARFDEDEEEWVSDRSIAQHQVAPDGRVTAVVGPDGRSHVFFQNASKQLVHLDEAWTPTVLSANPADGSPLLAMVSEGQVYFFYVSAGDNCMHCVLQQPGGGWTDDKLPKYVFESKLKSFVMALEDEGSLAPLALTVQSQMLLFDSDGKCTVLGKVDAAGKFVSSSPEQNTRTMNCPACSGPTCPMYDFTHLRVGRQRSKEN